MSLTDYSKTDIKTHRSIAQINAMAGLYILAVSALVAFTTGYAAAIYSFPLGILCLISAFLLKCTADDWAAELEADDEALNG